MTESERQRLISSTPHLSPDEIAKRTFTNGVRGFTEAEVRAFLKRVSEEMVAARDRERELLARSTRSRSSSRNPGP